jgi:ankyrin repeat protein
VAVCVQRMYMNGIWEAAEEGDLAEVQRLIGQNPRLLNATRAPHAMTPLMRAAVAGHVAVVRWLVDQGAALDEPSSDGWTALCYASSTGRTPVVRLLLERGADPIIANGRGCTPLIRACKGGHLETVWCLLDHPRAAAAIHHRDHVWGVTALWEACSNGNGEVVRALLEKGADPTLASPGGRTPMAMAKLYKHAACIEALEVRCS